MSRRGTPATPRRPTAASEIRKDSRSEEHTSELQSPCNLVCRLLLEKKKKTLIITRYSLLSHPRYGSLHSTPIGSMASPHSASYSSCASITLRYVGVNVVTILIISPS